MQAVDRPALADQFTVRQTIHSNYSPDCGAG